MEKLIAKINAPADKINAKAHRLEDSGFQYEYAVIDPRQGYAIITLRTYCKTGARWTACLWVQDREAQVYCSGSGQATGHGYCRQSAASAAAISAAGIALSAHIAGCGMETVREALLAIAAALHPRRKMIFHTAHA